MSPKATILTVLFATWTSYCHSQEDVNSFRQIVTAGRKGNTYIHGSVPGTTWRTFLGYMPSSAGRPKQAVISEFKKVKAAATWHGHSNVYFVDKKGKTLQRIIIGMPEDLPTKLEGSKFYFKKDGKVVVAEYRLVGPSLFCVGLTTCYEVVSEEP